MSFVFFLFRRTVSIPSPLIDDDDDEDDLDEDDLVHPSKCFQFLVGNKGRHDLMGVGGSWSPSSDGTDPENDPQVLIRTAIR